MINANIAKSNNKHRLLYVISNYAYVMESCSINTAFFINFHFIALFY